MRKFPSALKVIVSIAILVFLFRRANLIQGVRYLSQLHYPFLLLSIVLIVLGQVVRARRLAIMVFGGFEKRKVWQTMRIQMVSFLPGIVSPAKVGEVAKIYMLQSELDVPVGRGLACFVAERVLDLVLLGPLAALGLFVLFRSGPHISLGPGWTPMGALIIFAVVAALAVGFVWARGRGISLADLWRTISPERGIEAAALTLVYWGVVFLEVWCFCHASLFEAKVWHIVLVVPPALLSSMIPISFSGFGLREAAMIILLQRPPIGADYERAFLISLMYDIIGLGVPALMGVLFWVMGKDDGAS